MQSQQQLITRQKKTTATIRGVDRQQHYEEHHHHQQKQHQHQYSQREYRTTTAKTSSTCAQRHQHQQQISEADDEGGVAAVDDADGDEDRAADQILQAIIGRVCTQQQNVYEFRQGQESIGEQTTTDDSDDQNEIHQAALRSTQTTYIRRREQKAQAKISNHCYGCQQSYIRVDQEHQLCHNCIKMYQAVRRTIAANRGTYVYDRETATFDIGCQQGHTWTVRLEARKGRGWCQICSTTARRQHKQQVRRELEQARRERASQEQRLFQEAAQNEQICTVIEEEQKVDQQVQQVQEVMEAIQRREEHRISAEQIEQLTINIVQIDEEQIIRIIHSIAEEHRERVHRHIKSILHPDKNKGAYATEAFQKYNNSSKSKPPSLSKPSFMSGFNNNWWYLLKGLETLNLACAAAA